MKIWTSGISIFVLKQITTYYDYTINNNKKKLEQIKNR